MIFHLGDRMKSDTSLPINGVRVVLLFSMQQEAEVLLTMMVLMVLAQLEHFVTLISCLRMRQ